MLRHLVDGFASSGYGTAAALAVLAIVVVYVYSTNTYGIWRRLNVAHVRPWPLVGNTFRMLMALEHHVDTYDRLYRRFAGHKYCGVYQMKTPLLMIRDPALVHRILVKDFAYFEHRGFHKRRSTNVLADSMFFAKGPKWWTMRRKLTAAFSYRKLAPTIPLIEECTRELMRHLADSVIGCGDIEVHDTMADYSVDVIGTCAFGLRLGGSSTNDADDVQDDQCDRSEIRAYARLMVRPSFRMIAGQILVSTLPRIASALRFKEFPPEASDFFDSAFRRVIRYRTTENIVRDDVAQSLVQARNDLVLNGDKSTADQDKFTDEDIVSNAILMFGAGFETTSTTLSFCLYQLALNQDVQNRQREEIISAREKHKQINSEFLANLPYTNMVLDETERMYVIVNSLFREAVKTYHVPDDSLVIEKGTKIMIPFHSIHHDPNYFPNPFKFDPQRFSPEEKAKRPSCTHIPFGKGPRSCIGKRFAELEMKILLSEILTKFRILPCKKTEVPLKLQNGVPIMVPINGIWLNFQPISGK